MSSIVVQFGLIVCSAVATPAGYAVGDECEIPSVSRVEVTIDDGKQSCPLTLNGTLVDGRVTVRRAS